MKKRVVSIVMAAVLCCLLCCPVMAAEAETEGIYAVSSPQTVYAMCDSGGAPIMFASAEVNGTPVSDFYAGAVRFSVTVSGVTADNQYMIYVLNAAAAPSQENIVYANQLKADDSVITFDNVYPRAMESGKYWVYVTGQDRPFKADTPAATFQYHVPSRYSVTLTVESRVTGQSIGAALKRNGTAVTIDPAAVADNDGHFAWTELMYGNYELTLRKDGFVPRTEEFTLSDDKEMTVQLVAKGDLVGNGAAVAGVNGALDMQCLYEYLSTDDISSEGISDVDYFKAVADVNGNGVINILDYQCLYEMVRDAG